MRVAAAAGATALGLTGLGFAVVPAASASSTPECRTVDLGFTLKAGSPGAGQRFATVVLTNAGGHTCSVTGYGGLGLLGKPGQGVPTDLRRQPSPAPRTVVLAPGRSARSLLHWSVIPGPGEPSAVCEPIAATAAITPPDETTAALRAWTLGQVCEHGLISQNAYVAGSAAF
jgi:hypothetical protein